jgi:hypothetical protein
MRTVCLRGATFRRFGRPSRLAPDVVLLSKAGLNLKSPELEAQVSTLGGLSMGAPGDPDWEAQVGTGALKQKVACATL